MRGRGRLSRRTESIYHFGHTGTTSDNTLATPFPVPPFQTFSSGSGSGSGSGGGVGGGGRGGGDRSGSTGETGRAPLAVLEKNIHEILIGVFEINFIMQDRGTEREG